VERIPWIDVFTALVLLWTYGTALRGTIQPVKIAVLLPWSIAPLLAAVWIVQLSVLGAGHFDVVEGFGYVVVITLSLAGWQYGASGLKLDSLGYPAILRAFYVLGALAIAGSFVLVAWSGERGSRMPDADVYRGQLERQRDGRDIPSSAGEFHVTGPHLRADNSVCELDVYAGGVVRTHIPTSLLYDPRPKERACAPVTVLLDRAHDLVFVPRQLEAWEGPSFLPVNPSTAHFASFIAPPIGWIFGGAAGFVIAICAFGLAWRVRRLRARLRGGIEAKYEGDGIFSVAGEPQRVQCVNMPPLEAGAWCTFYDVNHHAAPITYRESALPTMSATPVAGRRADLLHREEKRELGWLLFATAASVTTALPLVAYAIFGNFGGAP